ncbi:MAG TPA: sugar phosphate isomerase/epimerase family protein [bacterium]|nr:sugar phosphate isomerase/epimerase family protein [bacterium]
MQVNERGLKKLDVEFAGYLEGDRIGVFFKEFEVKFAAGHWCAGGFLDRFATVGYNPGLKSDIISQLKRIAAAGIEGVEFHENIFIDARRRKNPARIAEVKDALKEYRLVPTNMNTNLWTDPHWKFGGVTNPNRKVREEALEITIQGAEIARELGCTSVALWPGADGWDYNFEANYGVLLEQFVQACIEINRRAKKLGLRFGIEAKMKEPREGHMIIPTTHCAVLVARKVNQACGGQNMGVAVDYGHEMMNGLEPAFNLYVAKEFGVPVVNFHVNSAKWRSNDEDRVAGTANLWQMVDFCYAALDTGYRGWFGEDQFTYRLDPVKAMSLSRELFANCLKKALLIWRERKALVAAQATGDAGRTLDVVKKMIY